MNIKICSSTCNKTILLEKETFLNTYMKTKTTVQKKNKCNLFYLTFKENIQKISGGRIHFNLSVHLDRSDIELMSKMKGKFYLK
jgi:hypothetical protein